MSSGKIHKTTVRGGDCPHVNRSASRQVPLPLSVLCAPCARTGLPPAFAEHRLSRLTFLLLMLGLTFFFLPSPPAYAWEWPEMDFELSSVFSYLRFTNDYPFIKDHLTNEAVFEMKASGVFPKEDWYYALGIISTADASTSFFSGCAVQELMLNTVINADGEDYLYEVGKEDWEWGKSFSRTPTYPMPEGYFWGAQWTKTKERQHVIVGVATSTDQLLKKQAAPVESTSEAGALTAWLRSGGFLTASDYEFVFSYQSHAQDALTPACYNLGFDTSRDFLNGLAIHGSINLSHTPKTNEEDSARRVDCLVGGEYTLGAKVIVCEVLHQSDSADTSLVWAVNNYSAFFATWQWGVESLWNLSDGGRYFKLFLEYTALERFFPSLEVLLFTGSEKSKISSSPVDLLVSLELRAVL